MQWYKLLALAVLTAVFQITAAQVPVIIEDPKVEELIAKHIEFNKANAPKGFRVAIFSEAGNNSKSLAINERNAFAEIYSDIGIYMIFDEPYFKIKVGNFKTRLEARKFLEKIKNLYPNAYIVKDDIEIKVMLNSIGSEIQEDYNKGFQTPIEH